MSQKLFTVPEAFNEPVWDYLPGSPEKASLDGKEVKTDRKVDIYPPHNLKNKVGYYYQGDGSHVKMAIDAALKAKDKWAAMSWEHRASIFLKMASLLAGPYRDRINAATMIGQSKTVHQAEIDAVCEMIDFLKFNVQFMEDIYLDQPQSSEGIWNRIEYRPLEGFVFALTPFNFSSIAGNLPTAPAMMGNTVVWKCSRTQVFCAKVLMDLFQEAGLPDGVINLVFASGPVVGEVILEHPDFTGIHFTGSTEVFQGIWKKVGENIHKYKSYPRIVGETGGKDYPCQSLARSQKRTRNRSEIA